MARGPSGLVQEWAGPWPGTDTVDTVPLRRASPSPKVCFAADHGLSATVKKKKIWLLGEHFDPKFSIF